ncbi:hypothetical protein N0V93_008004 [Gnomoniopsis smithogilvyi]|uniref:RNI-like protein n=1 Tax=Gnomoniopsis smithogilvyi TaxID=1191159 RepID=A0A9W8YL69_9PEZI|nr:hypothetical protein N0V93_008004 [Gnomoniopsis smithogilvyi]
MNTHASHSALLLQNVHDGEYKRVPADVLGLPRRRPHSQREEAPTIASFMFPEYSPEKALIQYEYHRKRAVAAYRAMTTAKLAEQQLRREMNRPDRNQSPWDPHKDPVALPKAAPMPVEIGERDDFQDCFAFLKDCKGDRVKVLLNMPDPASIPPSLGVAIGEEPIYKSRLLEFKRGVVYEDGRLDLCKMVVGPDHIDELMDSLENNTHIRHFLLGNNVITNHGARRIAKFVRDHPERMKTWYLAGNHIKPAGFSPLARVLEGSEVLEQLWLKRNPLGQSSVDNILNIITTAKRLQILDIETCELGEEGLAHLFTSLLDKPNTLETIYINGNGVGPEASMAIAKFLASPGCKLRYLMMSSNPLGDEGAINLASCIADNTTLEVLTVASCGLSSKGVSAISDALACHPKIRHLDLGSRFTTADLGQRFNYIDDDAIAAIKKIVTNSSLNFLHLGYVTLSANGLEEVRDAVVSSSSLVGFEVSRSLSAEETEQTHGQSCSLRVRQALETNYLRLFGGKGQMAEGVPYKDFISMSGPSRLLRNSPGVRLIDSVYRTRDKGRTSSGKVRKYWDLEHNEKDREIWERLDRIE